jgi:hypothetical protein
VEQKRFKEKNKMSKPLTKTFEALNVKSAKLSELDTLFTSYSNKIENSLVGDAFVPAVLKELKNLIDEVEHSNGMLNESEDAKLEAIKDNWLILCKNQGYTVEQIDNTELLYRTSTGREKALPVYKRRFDA